MLIPLLVLVHSIYNVHLKYLEVYDLVKDYIGSTIPMTHGLIIVFWRDSSIYTTEMGMGTWTETNIATHLRIGKDPTRAGWLQPVRARQ
jgi:hypothetical protein